MTVSGWLRVGPVVENLVRASATGGLLVLGAPGTSVLAGLRPASVSTEVAAQAVGPVMMARARRSTQTSLPVVVAVDGSLDADAAVAFAAEEARLRGVQLLALHVAADLPVYLDRRPDPLSTGALGLISGDLQGLALRRRRIDGDVRGSLVNASAEAAVIVVGAHGMGRPFGAHLGSTSRFVSHHARCSVLVVRAATLGEFAPPA